MQSIPYGRQSISDEDIEAVVKVLRSDFLTQGPEVPSFEKNIQEYTGSHYSLAVNSATSALHLACLSLGVGSGDIVWTSPITFVATSNSALYCGASVDFVDIEPKTRNLCVLSLEKKLIEARLKNRLPKVVIPVHFAGLSCDMQKIKDLSLQYGFKIIEDASHAIGASYLDYKVGSCKFSDLCIFSFHPVKIITTAEGGMITTNDPELYQRALKLRSHGITRKSDELKHNDGPWYYEQVTLGYNYRMTEIQAALGSSQLRRLNRFVDRRNELALIYSRLLVNCPLILPKVNERSRSAFHLYVVEIDESKTQKARKSFFEFLASRGVGVNVHYIPVYKQPYYQENGFGGFSLPNAENYYRNALTLPLFPDMKLVDLEHICKMISDYFLEDSE